MVVEEQARTRAEDTRPFVLVVDDEPAIVEMCRGYLAAEACEVLGATSGEEALRVASEKPVHVVIADHAMPGMSGVEVLERIRAASPDTVRVLYTGVLDTRIAEQATSRAEVFRFLVKPFPPEVLRNVVRQALAYRRTLEENRRFHRELERLVETQARELAEAKGFLEALLDALPAGVLAVDLDGRITRVNREALRILGHQADQLVGRSVEDVGVPCRPDRCRSHETGGQRCRNRELEVKDRWGMKRTLLWSCEEVRTPHGTRLGCTATFVDVSEKKDLEVTVFQAKQEIEAVFDSITDPTAVVEPDGRVVRANRAFSHFVDRPFQDLLGHALVELLGPTRTGPVPELMKEVQERKTPSEREHHDPAGSVYRIRVFPMFKHGRVDKMVVRYQDVTAERELEHRLLQSEKMASVGQLAAGIAHEINNPVGFILSNLNRLAEYVEDLKNMCCRAGEITRSVTEGRMEPAEAWRAFQQAREAADLEFVIDDLGAIVEECREGAERIRKIVVDLKTFSHPGGEEWQYADLNACLESTLNIAWNELKYHCDVVRDYGEIPQVLCRPQQLNQVFLNLIVNAAQAIPDRGTVTVRTRAEGDRVVVEISDTGVGIPEENLRKIFDPFFTTKPVGKGTGLGLHLAAGIVRNHGGEIQVESEEGKGSTFRVVLPVIPPEAPKEPRKEEA